MSNLDFQNSIKNLVTEIDPDIEKDPSLKRFWERFSEEIFQPENIHKASQQKITSITIENFKCIGNAVTIPIRPITLLFGKNSSGKSTVLQALLYYFATWNAEWSRIIKTGVGYDMDPKDFRYLVHRQDLDRKIRICVEYAYALNIIDIDDVQISHWQEVVTGWKKGHPYVVSLLFGIRLNGEEALHFRWKTEETPDDTVIGSNGEKLIRLEKNEENFPKDFLNNETEIYVNTNITHKGLINYYLDSFRNWQQNPQEFERTFSPTIYPDIRHLGSFRLPLRDYQKSKTSDESQWETGLGAWDVLARDPEMVKKTNHYIQNVLRLGYSINRRAHNATDSEQWPRLHDENSDIDVRLSDIGVGIAQIIPVVVGALDDSHSPGIFAVEQPELHVHPAVQVALGDVFIDSIKSSDYPNMQEFLDQSPAMQEVSDKFLSKMEDSKEELLNKIKNINEPAIEAILDTIIGIIKDKDPLDVEEFLDMIIGMIKDSDSLDVRFKNLFTKIKEKYSHNSQAAIKEFTKKFIKECLDNTKNSNRTMLIETHSEHLLLRLLRRVRETNVRNSKKYEWRQSSMPPLHREMSEAAIRDAEYQDSKDHQLTPDDLSVIYVQPTPEGVKFTPLAVTNDGDFNAPWPEGFFDERVEELL